MTDIELARQYARTVREATDAGEHRVAAALYARAFALLAQSHERLVSLQVSAVKRDNSVATSARTSA
jgi:hypothetical protein